MARILLVEDDEGLASAYRRILTVGTGPEPVQVECVRSFREALELTRARRRAQTPFAVAFVDLQLAGGRDGLDTLDVLHKEDPDLQTALCTGADVAPALIARRVTDPARVLLLRKPLHPAEVQQIARCLCDKWRLARSLRQANESLFLEVAERTRAHRLVAKLARLCNEASSVEAASRGLDAVLHAELGASEVELNVNPDRRIETPVPGHNRAEALEAVDCEATRWCGDRLTVTMPMHAGEIRLRLAARQLEPVLVDALVTGCRQLAEVVRRARAERRRDEATEEAARARDEAEEASGAKSSFLAAMSHALRTPLHGILGTADLLPAHGLAPDGLALLDGLQSSARGLLAVVDDVLDVARLEAGRSRPRETECDPRRLVRAVARQGASAARLHRVVVRTAVDGAPEKAWIDAARVRQVLGRLMSFAIERAEGGEVRLTARTWEGGLAFTVSHSGSRPIRGPNRPGIVVPGAARRGTPSDLGLAIVERRVAAMAGRLSVDARADGACELQVWFPLVASPPARSMALRVLVVDDNPVNRLVARKLIERLGGVTGEAADGVAAIEAVLGGEWDLVLMDYEMPGMNGDEVTRRIRALVQPPPRVVGVSAHALPEIRDACLAAGMDDWITKPLTVDQLRPLLGTPAA